MWILDKMVLPEDVVLIPVDRLPAAERSGLGDVEVTFVLRRAGVSPLTFPLAADLVPLVERFRKPRAIIDAVVEFSEERQRDAALILDEAYPLLERLLEVGLMRPAGWIKKESGIPPSFPEGGPSEDYTDSFFQDLRTEEIFSNPPMASVNYGAAGVAYGFYHVARARGDSALLERAERWAWRAFAARHEEQAFYNESMGLGAKSVGRVTPYHTASGVAAVRALVSHARGDRTARDEAVAAFLRAAQSSCANPDLVLGWAGLLLASAFLVRALGVASPLELFALGESTVTRLRRCLRIPRSVGEDRSLGFLGIAHGWGGLLYALLLWSRVAGSSLPAFFVDRLTQLAELGESAGRGIRWRRRVDRKEKSPYLATWCHGAAGLVHLWVLAYRIFGDERYLELARKSAWNTWEEGSTSIAHLCCGLSGRAYGLLSFYKLTGEKKWLERARRLAAAAADLPSRLERSHSLYKGRLGTAVLIADLEDPQRALMPFFEVDLPDMAGEPPQETLAIPEGRAIHFQGKMNPPSSRE